MVEATHCTSAQCTCMTQRLRLACTALYVSYEKISIAGEKIALLCTTVLHLCHCAHQLGLWHHLLHLVGVVVVLAALSFVIDKMCC